MNRRELLQSVAPLLTAPRALVLPASVAPAPRYILIQESPIAGFQYHSGESLWPLLREQGPLQLKREPHNAYDERAIALHFMSRRIGYVPRAENTAISQMLDRGERLHARIVHLARDPDPWKRVRIAVEVEV